MEGWVGELAPGRGGTSPRSCITLDCDMVSSSPLSPPGSLTWGHIEDTLPHVGDGRLEGSGTVRLAVADSSVVGDRVGDRPHRQWSLVCHVA